MVAFLSSPQTLLLHLPSLPDAGQSRALQLSHCGFLVHSMRALGREMLKTWNDGTAATLHSTAISLAGRSQSLNEQWWPEGWPEGLAW